MRWRMAEKRKQKINWQTKPLNDRNEPPVHSFRVRKYSLANYDEYFTLKLDALMNTDGKCILVFHPFHTSQKT